MVREALSDTPVVLIHGPRQAGKSTLARQVAEAVGGFRHLNFDDALPRGAALQDPTEFIESLMEPVVIDEVQRVPEIFLPIKSNVDRKRRPGRFLLTGSSNILTLPKVADSLAGRMAIIDLYPLSQAEIEEEPESNFIERMFDRNPISLEPFGESNVVDRILRGGFPDARSRASASRRDAWFSDYVRSLLDRDVRDISNIESLSQVPKLLNLIATRAGSTLNIAAVARDAGIANTTLHRYIDLLKAVFLIHFVPAWSSNRGNRLTKAPKAYLVDTGLLAHLDNITAATIEHDRSRLGPLMENFVATELLKLSATSEARCRLYHLRTVKQLEVDFVLEARGGDVVGIEVKAASTVRLQDADGLKFLKELAGEKFARGVIFYTGKEVMPITRDITAVPIDALWTRL